MRAAMERGDVDEAARQGALAGPEVIADALANADRATRLAAAVAAPSATGAAGLLEPLAAAAAGPDRRTAIPAAHAARTIARSLAAGGLRDVRAEAPPDSLDEVLPDDVASEDLGAWRAAWAALAMRRDRWIEVRVLAIDVAAALDAGGTGVDLPTTLTDPDPAIRRAVIAVVPVPVPATMRGALAGVVVHDTEPSVALAAAQVLCFDLVGEPAKPVLDALGAAGLARIRALVGPPATGPRTALRDATRCLTAAKKLKL